MPSPIVNLYDHTETGITEIMDGPWREVRIEKLDAGGTLSLASVDQEHAAFVIDGSASITTPDGAWPLVRSSAFALPLTGSAELFAGVEGLTLLIVTLNVAV